MMMFNTTHKDKTMATQKSSHTPKLSLNTQHDYITLRTPNGNFTVSRSGYKATGKIDRTVLTNLVNFVKTGSFGERMEQLLDPTVLSKYFPNWDAVVNTPILKVGQTVKVDHPKVLRSYGTIQGVVEKINGKNVVVRFPNGRLSVPKDMVTV